MATAKRKMSFYAADFEADPRYLAMDALANLEGIYPKSKREFRHDHGTYMDSPDMYKVQVTVTVKTTRVKS